MNSLPSSPGGFSDPSSPFSIESATQEILNQQVMNSPAHGHPQHPGAIRTKELEITPLVQLTHLSYTSAEAAVALQAPKFKNIDVSKSSSETSTIGLYQKLRRNLPPEIQSRLDANDEALEEGRFEDIDQEVAAFNQSLQKRAGLMAFSMGITEGHEEGLDGANQFSALQQQMDHNLIGQGQWIGQVVNHYLSRIGANDLSFQALQQGTTQLTEASTMFQSVDG